MDSSPTVHPGRALTQPTATGSTAAPSPVTGRWARRAGIALGAVCLLLTAWSFALPLLTGLGVKDMPWWREFFSVNHEENLTAWWSAGLLLLAGVGFLAVGLLRRGLRADRPRTLAAWVVPGLLLAGMSLDETTQLHERADLLWDAIPFLPENPLTAFRGLIVSGPVAVVVIVVVVLLARALPRRTRVLASAGVLVFFLGAIGFEAIPLLLDIWASSWAYHAVTHLEELTEMLGAVLLVLAPWVHLHLDRSHGRLTVTTDR